MNLINQITDWLDSYLDESGLKCFVVGISGGIDSALVSTLCARTGKKTIVVSLPIHQNKEQLERAILHMKWLGERFKNVEFISKDLSNLFDQFKETFSEQCSDLSLANSRSRLRMTSIYQISAFNNGLVVGTGNKIEDFGIGFFTKYGDGGVDISPIADLYKTEVWNLSKELGILNSIVEAKPTDGLWQDDRTDEQQIGATYSELEWAMDFLIKEGGNNSKEENISQRQKEVIKIFNKMNLANKHKMVPIPIFKKK